MQCFSIDRKMESIILRCRICELIVLSRRVQKQKLSFDGYCQVCERNSLWEGESVSLFSLSETRH